jgi:hypothetical protein
MKYLKFHRTSLALEGLGAFLLLHGLYKILRGDTENVVHELEAGAGLMAGGRFFKWSFENPAKAFDPLKKKYSDVADYVLANLAAETKALTKYGARRKAMKYIVSKPQILFLAHTAKRYERELIAEYGAYTAPALKDVIEDLDIDISRYCRTDYCNCGAEKVCHHDLPRSLIREYAAVLYLRKNKEVSRVLVSKALRARRIAAQASELEMSEL